MPCVFWLGLWWAFAAAVGQELLVPTPWRVLCELCELAGTAAFWQTVGFSLCRIFCGVMCGAVLGVLAALLCCRFALVDDLLAPVIRVMRATPVASFIILLLLWVHTGAVPCVVSAMMVLPVIWETATAGIHAADPDLLEMAQVYKMPGLRRVRYIYLPALRPHLAAGLCTSIGLAWKSGVAAEVLCLPRPAIGAQVYYAKIYLGTPALFAWTITVVLLSLLIEGAVRRLMEVQNDQR